MNQDSPKKHKFNTSHIKENKQAKILLDAKTASSYISKVGKRIIQAGNAPFINYSEGQGSLSNSVDFAQSPNVMKNPQLQNNLIHLSSAYKHNMPTETTIETLLKDIKVMAPTKEQILQQKFGINPKNLNRINDSKTLRDTFQKANAYYEHSEATQMPSHNPQYQEIVSVNLPLRASLNKDNQTFLMKVDSKQGKRVPNTFEADLSYAQNSSYNEDSTIRKAQSTVRSQFTKGASPEKDYHFRNLIDSEVIESVLEPINGIEDLIKDTPEQLFIKHQLTTYKTQQNHRNRAKLREMMANTKPAQFEAADKNAGGEEKEFFDELQSFGSKIMNLNDEILEQVKHSRIQGLDTNERFQRYPGGNEVTILDLKS